MCGGMKEVSIKRLNLFYIKQLLGPKKVGRANKSGLRLVKMHLFTPKN